MKTITSLFFRVALLVVVAAVPQAQAERIKDLASIAGVRDNQLLGYGLVVGLDGTGDSATQTRFTAQSLRAMLAQYGIAIPPNITPGFKNIAAVMVHADLPAFAKPGQTIDVTASSLGDAKSLRGGTLLMTPLKGADGKIYAIEQGNLIVGGFGVDAGDGSSITVNVPSVGRVPSGATVERSVPNPFANGNSILLNLNTPDFTTAKHLTDQINHVIGPNIARAAPAAVTHGSLTVSITANNAVSQPNAFAEGETVEVQNNDIEVTQEANRMFLFSAGVTLSEIVQAVNQVGAAPGDLVAILEALKQVGALRAQLVVI